MDKIAFMPVSLPSITHNGKVKTRFWCIIFLEACFSNIKVREASLWSPVQSPRLAEGFFLVFGQNSKHSGNTEWFGHTYANVGLWLSPLLSTTLAWIIEPIQCSSGFVTRFSPSLSVPAKAQNLTPQNICGHHATFPIHANIASEDRPGRKR